MATIDDVIQANEDLSLAIETYASACKPLKFKGMSFAMEEAQEDSKDQAKEGVWAKFKAFIKRIKDWFMGLFKKRKEKLDQIEELEKKVDVKKEMDFSSRMEEALKEASKPAAAQPTPEPAAAKPAESKPEPVKETPAEPRKPEPHEYETAFNAKRGDIERATKDIIRKILANKFSSDYADIMRIVMSDTSSGDSNKIGRKIADAFSEVTGRLDSFGRVLTKIDSEAKLGHGGYEEINESIKVVNAIIAGTDAGKVWVDNVQNHSVEEMVSAYKRYCGFVVDINSGLNSRSLRNIERSLSNVTEQIDRFAAEGKGTPEVLESIRKTYAESIVPVSNTFGKILNLYSSALDQSFRNQHLIGSIRDAGVQGTRQVLGENTTKHISLIVIGKMLNEIMA